jgi:hypothetical protein
VLSKGFPLQLSSLPLQTIMELPLHKLLVLIDDSHWTVKHKTFLGQQFFIFDESQDRLRLRVQGEYNRYPRLCAKLFHDILQTRIVELHSCVWPHILEAPPNEMISWSTHSLVTTVASSTQWKLCSPLVIRQTMQATISTDTQYIPSIIKIFWTCPMYPNARTVYFLCLSKCIPTKKVLVKYGIAPSTICSFCHLQEDSRRHFLVDCPWKWSLWQQLLSHYFPDISISSELLYGSLRYLHIPQKVRDKKSYLSIISTILYALWTLYWQHGIDNPQPCLPSNRQHSFSKIVTQIERLLNPFTD